MRKIRAPKARAKILVFLTKKVNILADFLSKFTRIWTKIFACGADRRRRREKFSKLNSFKAKKHGKSTALEGVITPITPPQKTALGMCKAMCMCTVIRCGAGQGQCKMVTQAGHHPWQGCAQFTREGQGHHSGHRSRQEGKQLGHTFIVGIWWKTLRTSSFVHISILELSNCHISILWTFP